MWIKIGQDLEGDVEGIRILLYSLAKNYTEGNNQSTYAAMNFEELLNGYGRGRRAKCGNTAGRTRKPK